jgi:hypothetical protein
MPIYQFVVRSGDHEDDPDVRWSHLPSDPGLTMLVERSGRGVCRRDCLSDARWPLRAAARATALR